MMKFFDIQTGEEPTETTSKDDILALEGGYLPLFDINNKYMGYSHNAYHKRMIPELMNHREMETMLANNNNPIEIVLLKWERITNFLSKEESDHIIIPWEYYSVSTCALCAVYLHKNNCFDENEDNEDCDPSECGECPLYLSGNRCMEEYDTDEDMSIWELFNEYQTVDNANKMIEAIEELL